MSLVRYGKTIPIFVKRLRQDLGISQTALGRQMGVHGQYVSNVERGKLKSYVGFVSLLMGVCPQDRKEYLIDLLGDAAATHAVRRLGKRALKRKVIHRTRRKTKVR